MLFLRLHCPVPPWHRLPTGVWMGGIVDLKLLDITNSNFNHPNDQLHTCLSPPVTLPPVAVSAVEITYFSQNRLCPCWYLLTVD